MLPHERRRGGRHTGGRICYNAFRMTFPTSPAKRLRVMHFADVHFGVETYGKYNPETGLNTRLEDFTKALNQAVDGALFRRY